MTLFQQFGITLLLASFLGILWGISRHRLSPLGFIFWSALWVLAGAAILNPRLTVLAAKVLGIGRGADLVFYCAILAGLFGFFLFYMHLRRIEQNLTRLTRALALEEQLRAELETSLNAAASGDRGH